MELAFFKELGGMFRKLESKGNPWGLAPRKRMDWAKGLDFEVPVIGVDVEDASEVDYLFWVGCAGAYEDRAKRTTRAVAELLQQPLWSNSLVLESQLSYHGRSSYLPFRPHRSYL